MTNDELRKMKAGRAVSLLLVAGCAGPELRLTAPRVIDCDTKLHHRAILVDYPAEEGALVIRTDGVTLDLSCRDLIGGAGSLPPDQYVGRGIVVRDARNVTIRNAKIRGFRIAIYAENAPGLTIETCDVSDNYRQRLGSTPEKEDPSDWLYGHDNDNNEWLRYGAGIYLYKCEGPTIRHCRARNGQNGICLVRCDQAGVIGNDMSFMSGWGLAMWRSSGCKVIGNRFDYCVRGYSHGVYARGQDSTGILVYEQCSDNVFAYNHATHGGDGFFLYAGNETLHRTGEGGCNRNLVYMNDFSYAVANGIEATFSDQNVFLSNRLIHCMHGVWAGYSRRSLILDNTIENCTHGVSIEHGRANRIFWNRFARCRDGLWLWWDEDRDLLDSAFAKKQGADSAEEYAERNEFIDCETAIKAHDSSSLLVNGNSFTRCRTALRLTGRTSVAGFVGNIISAGALENQTQAPLTGQRNLIAPDTSISGPAKLEQPAADRDAARAAVHHGPAFHQQDDAHPWPWERAREMNLPATSHGPPERLGTRLPGPLPGIPEGKEHIFITEWGPWDFSGPRPTTQPARN